ncbi:hypothetical protein R1flu_022247 [Riccia fluitans]|uniref:Uncharacterized protein n=1 Tax=Riccia fluitans TaxID=41844 RepID=A0ABD1ZRP3_9MARC
MCSTCQPAPQPDQASAKTGHGQARPGRDIGRISAGPQWPGSTRPYCVCSLQPLYVAQPHPTTPCGFRHRPQWPSGRIALPNMAMVAMQLSSRQTWP